MALRRGDDPVDAKSQFFPQVQFLAGSLARGEWPWWSPNVFAGWAEISDPQSLLFSPLHVLLAALNPVVSLRAFDAVTFAYLFLGGVGIILFFRDRGWHAGGALVAAMAFALAGSANARMQHTGQIISLAYLPLVLWLGARALERSSWRAGLAAGALTGLMAIGRDQVALLSLYVLAGFVLAHWLMGTQPLARMRASIKPLTAAAASAALVAAVPIMMTTLLAERSNRPEIGFDSAAGGSLHPVHLLQFAFADLFGAMDPSVEYWAPQSLIWDAEWGWPGLYLSQNMGLVYAGALTLVAVMSFGFIRGVAWAREIRFFTIAAGLLLLYTLGSYTPAFYLMYDLLPAVALYRRPADATFVLVALVAVIAGYLVHRWLTGSVPTATRRQRALEIACPLVLLAAALALASSVVGIGPALAPVATAMVFTATAVAVLLVARRLDAGWPAAAAGVLASFMAFDLAVNQAPHISTALPPGLFDALRPNTNDETVRLLKARIAGAAAPDRRDRVELIGIGYHWPNLGLVQGFDHVFGHNPLRLHSFQEATHASDTVALAVSGHFRRSIRRTDRLSPICSACASSQPACRWNRSIPRSSRAISISSPVPGMPTSTRTRARCRGDAADGLAARRFRGSPAQRLARRRSAPDGAAEEGAGWVPGRSRRGGRARLLRYANTEVVVEVEAPAGGSCFSTISGSPGGEPTSTGATLKSSRPT